MVPFRPGVHLLISRAESMLVPVGIAGAYNAWPVWRPYPILSPLFLPPSNRTIAVSVGEPISSATYAHMDRAKVLADLFGRVKTLKDRAERLRRK
jgi:hypothetical protein